MSDQHRDSFSAAAKFVEFGLREQRSGKRESASGPGSSVEAASTAANLIQRVMKREIVTEILDLGCGDMNWMGPLLHDLRTDSEVAPFRYHGWDAHAGLIAGLNERFGQSDTLFSRQDIVSSDYDVGDLIICRDVLFHLNDTDVATVLKKVLISKARYLVTTTHMLAKNDIDLKVNNGIENWFYRPINLDIHPYCFESRLLEYSVENTGDYKGAGRRVALYDVS